MSSSIDFDSHFFFFISFFFFFLFGRNPVVVRWHSFRRSSSSTSTMTFSSQPIAMGSLSVGQFALLRKLALLRLTALLERHTSSSKPSWGWDLPKFMRKTKSPDYKGLSFFFFFFI